MFCPVSKAYHSGFESQFVIFYYFGILTMLGPTEKKQCIKKTFSLKRRGNEKLSFTARLPEIDVTNLALSALNFSEPTGFSITLRYVAKSVQVAVQYREVCLILL